MRQKLSPLALCTTPSTVYIHAPNLPIPSFRKIRRFSNSEIPNSTGLQDLSSPKITNTSSPNTSLRRAPSEPPRIARGTTNTHTHTHTHTHTQAPSPRHPASPPHTHTQEKQHTHEHAKNTIAPTYSKQNTQEYKFKWGVGNHFKSKNHKKTWSSPPSKEVEKEMTLPDDYFHCDIPNIKWEPLNESWDVYFFENDKLSAKPFPVKKFGAQQSKDEAIEFYNSLPASYKDGKKMTSNARAAPFNLPQKGVFWDQETRSWVCLYREKGNTMSRAFSADLHGFEEAKEMAINRKNRGLAKLGTS